MWHGCVSVLIGLAIGLCACGPATEDESDDGSASASGSDEAAEDTTLPGDELTHGFVQLELRRGESQSDDPFVGTARVRVTLEYEACLVSFYEDNPALRAEGADGSLVFGPAADGGEGWRDRLCDATTATHVDCVVSSIDQTLDTVKRLTVSYSVSGSLEGGVLLFGPLPNLDTAHCDTPTYPSVRFGSESAVEGIDGDGKELWGTESASPATAITDQGAPIRLGIARKYG